MPTVIVAQAERRTVPVYQEFIGQTQAVNTVEIRSQVMGFLRSINFREGATVEKGQLLFEIDPRQYQAALAQAQAQLEQAQAVLNNDEKDLARDRALFSSQVIPRQTLDTQSSQTRAARANVGAAEAGVEQARLNLSFTRIYAPLAGRIDVAQVKVGGLVQAGTTLLDTIYSINPIYVNFSVTEQTYLDYAQLMASKDYVPPPAPPVELILPNQVVYRFLGKIDMSTPAVNSATGTLGLRAVFPNPAGILRAGLFVRVRLMVREEPDAVLVPLQAIEQVQGAQHVLIVGPHDTVELRAVTTGATVGKSEVILSGVTAGERVIVEGLQKVRPGMTVSVAHAQPVTQSVANQPALQPLRTLGTDGGGSTASSSPAAESNRVSPGNAGAR